MVMSEERQITASAPAAQFARGPILAIAGAVALVSLWPQLRHMQ